MRRVLLLSFAAICLSIAIGCSDEKTPSNENVTVVIDSIETAYEDNFVADSTKATAQFEESKTNKCSTIATWITGLTCFILGIVLTLGSILLIKFIKKKHGESTKPIIKAVVASEDDESDKILRDLIIEK